jgi:ribosomal protein S3
MIEVVIYTAKASLILGKTSENKERIETLLTRKL